MGALTYTTAQVQSLLDKTGALEAINGIVKCNGSGTLSAQTVDTTVTEDSANLVTSGAVYAVVGDVESVLEALL